MNHELYSLIEMVKHEGNFLMRQQIIICLRKTFDNEAGLSPSLLVIQKDEFRLIYVQLQTI